MFLNVKGSFLIWSGTNFVRSLTALLAGCQYRPSRVIIFLKLVGLDLLVMKIRMTGPSMEWNILCGNRTCFLLSADHIASATGSVVL